MAKRGRPKKNPTPTAPGNEPKHIKTEAIDIEPKWETLFNFVIGDLSDAKHDQLEYFRAAIKLMDVIRQAQKHGARGVNFTFTPDGQTTYEVIR